MLQAIMQHNMLLYGIGILMFLGAASQIWLWGIYGRMTKDMENERMAKGKFIKQIRQRYGLQKRMGDGNINAEAFIERNLYQYRIFGRSLHQWRRTGAFLLAFALAVGMFGWYASGSIRQTAAQKETYLWAMGIASLVTGVVYALTDIRYKKEYLKTGLLDMLENGGSSVKNFETAPNPVREPDRGKIEKPAKAEVAAAAATAVPVARNGKLSLRKGKKTIPNTKEQNAEILKNMDPKEQERVIREVLKEFLLESGE